MHQKVNVVKVAHRVEKNEVFRKSWNFSNRAYFTSCIMRKHYFLLWTKETVFFPYFYHGINSTALSYVTAQSTLNFTWVLVHNSLPPNPPSAPSVIVEKIIENEFSHLPFPQFSRHVHRVWQTENLRNRLLRFTRLCCRFIPQLLVKRVSSIITVLFCLYEFSIDWRHNMTHEASSISSYTCQCCL